MANKSYYVSETDVAALLKMSGLPKDFQNLFSRDYVSVKNSIDGSGDEITNLDVRVTDNEDSIESLNVSFSTLNGTVVSLQSSYNSHASSIIAHGSNGNIVGTNNFATIAVGGTVKLSAAVTDQSASIVNVAATPNAAGAAYLQADAATWVVLLNELKSDLNALVDDHNSLRAKVNDILLTERNALQRAP